MDIRQIVSHPPILRLVAETLWEKIASQPFDLICGVPYTALPIATCFSLDHHIPMIMRRKEKKDYGTKQMIEGEYKPGQSCLIIEDVITSGGSIIETTTELEAAGLQVNDVIALVDREQGGRENLSRHFRPHTILTLSEILNTLKHSNLLKNEEQRCIEAFLN